MTPPQRLRAHSGRGVALALATLLAVGIALRAVATAAWWPISTSQLDATAYAYFAYGLTSGDINPLTNPQHPPGYSVFIALLGQISREVAVLGIVQHLMALAAALVLFLAIRRLCGSPWPGVVGAAVLLLNADQVHLERAITSEALFVPAVAVVIYAVSRMLEAPHRRWPWPAAVAVLVVVCATIRSSALFLIPVIALAMLFAQTMPWGSRWWSLGAFVGPAAVLLLLYAGLNQSATGRFEVTPATGWHLYGRVAPFASCSQFSPPPGTRGLCERGSRYTRNGTDYYLYMVDSPSYHVFGLRPFEHDEELGDFARRAILGQPKTYALTVWNDIKAYYVPSSFYWAPYGGATLSQHLNWDAPIDANRRKELRTAERGIENFFDEFSVRRNGTLLAQLETYQRIGRVGATVLFVCTLLTILGLLVGPRRNRVSVLVLGMGGLALFIPSTLSVIYVGRYSVPAGPLVAAGAAVTLLSLLRSYGPGREGRRLPQVPSAIQDVGPDTRL